MNGSAIQIDVVVRDYYEAAGTASQWLKTSSAPVDFKSLMKEAIAGMLDQSVKDLVTLSAKYVQLFAGAKASGADLSDMRTSTVALTDELIKQARSTPLNSELINGLTMFADTFFDYFNMSSNKTLMVMWNNLTVSALKQTQQETASAAALKVTPTPLMSQKAIAIMLNLTTSMLGENNCSQGYLAALEQTLTTIDDLTEVMLQNLRLGESAILELSKFRLFCLKDHYYNITSREVQVKPDNTTVLTPKKLKTYLANVPKLKSLDVVGFQFIEWYQNPVGNCPNQSTGTKYDIRFNRLMNPGRHLLVPADGEQMVVFNPNNAWNCSAQGDTCIPVRQMLQGSNSLAWGCQCDRLDYDLHHDVQVFSNLKKISDLSAVFSYNTLKHPVFIALAMIGGAVLALVLFKEEYPYVKYEIPRSYSKLRAFFVAFLTTHPLFSIFLIQNEELSPRKLLLLYYTRVMLETGFSSFFQVGTDYSELTFWDEFTLSFVTSIITKTLIKGLIILMSYDPNSPNEKEAENSVVGGQGTRKAMYNRLRVFAGGVLAFAACALSYYCIIAISLQSEPDVVQAWARMVVFSALQDQLLTHAIQVSISVVIVYVMIAHPHFRYRDRMIKVLVNPEYVELFEAMLNSHAPTRSTH
jgi:hypothetical protein